jgi:cell division protein FtsN
MAKQKKGDSYEMVLESRHLLGVFFAVVLLCALFFTLGFVLGRSQGQEQAQAAPAAKPPAAEPSGAPAAEDLTFYDRVEGKSAAETAGTGQGAASAVRPTPATTAAPAADPIYLQVAALSQEADAKRLSQKLLELAFPVVIRPPGDDRLYRVQVGPFQTKELADAAEQRLKAQGFRQIVRR